MFGSHLINIPLSISDANGQIKELVFPKALDLDRPKRARTTFSPEQLYTLETEFRRNQYLVGRERTELAERLGLSETQVGDCNIETVLGVINGLFYLKFNHSCVS